MHILWHELKLRVETAAAVFRCLVILPAWFREILSEQLKFDSHQGFCEIEKEKRSKGDRGLARCTCLPALVARTPIMSHRTGRPRANLRFAIHFRSAAAAINQLSFVSDIRNIEHGTEISVQVGTGAPGHCVPGNFTRFRRRKARKREERAIAEQNFFELR